MNLVAAQDRAIPPATQRFMASRAKATIRQVEASHVPMISKPASTTNLILQAAKSVASVNRGTWSAGRPSCRRSPAGER